jgi:hypothetical protein
LLWSSVFEVEKKNVVGGGGADGSVNGGELGVESNS